MKALKKLEQDFQGCMLRNDLDMAGQVVGDERADAAERVRIYVEGYRLRLLEILQDNFTGLHALLGDEQFDTLSRAYIDAHPSTHASVRWFSRHLESFLRSTPPFDAHAYLAEMAAFEWAQGLVFDATDAAVMGMQDLASLPPESWAGLRLKFGAAMQRLDCGWNVPTAWTRLEAGEDPGLEAEAGSRPWLLWRADLTTHWRSLTEDEAWALDAAKDGKNFGELCEGLCQWHAPEAVAMQAASYLKLWLSDGLITDIETE
ncbi:MAG TPA: DNA-binding domain-containing protein [Gammaproteobacteria bacterium]|nr:DNA-binding domain-containing protein [Gammaproteobacteria bacterium]